MTCFCGNPGNFEKCCGPFLAREEDAPSAEALMRSRYCAFKLRDLDYILETHDPQTRLQFDMEQNAAWAGTVEFQRLEVLGSEETGNRAIVEFRAHFLEGEQEKTHHEVSRFRRQGGLWFYRDGRFPKA